MAPPSRRLTTRVKRFLVQRLPGLETAQRYLYRFKPYRWKFRAHYLDHAWGHGGESRSGPGSSMKATRVIRDRLPGLLRTHGIRSMVDVPCGDFHWMKEVDLGDTSYLGLDIVEEMVAANTRTYGRPGVEFRVADMLRDPMPHADLVFCRDCLFHYETALVFEAIENMKTSGARYLMTTTFVGLDRNTEIAATGLFRKIALDKPPYAFPPPLELVMEDEEKAMGLWELASLPTR